MDYKRIYNDIIEKRKTHIVEGYGEKHHIIPKCMGGTNDKENIIKLTAREHFICHLLLVKINENTDFYYKLVKAFMMMFKSSSNQERYITSKTYEKLRIAFSEAQSIGQAGSNNSQFGKSRTAETKLKIKQALLDRNKAKREEKARQLEKKKLQKEEKRKNDVDLYREYYIIYSNKGWDEFVKTTGYKFSKVNLVNRFANLIPEFVPQNGKRRGK